jgi:uncharacterized protein (DUF58 family)
MNDSAISQWVQKHLVDRWERRWVSPAYAGWLLIFLTLFFFGSATNTMVGWLYVISGVSLAILILAAILPPRSLRKLKVQRQAIAPVSVGDQITVELSVINPTNRPVTLLQVRDLLPPAMGKASEGIEYIAPHQDYHWTYFIPTEKRGVHHWQQVELRSAAPFGLFYCRRSREAKATAVVYPQVLPLLHCPLIDEIGQESSPQLYEGRRNQMATEGVTRTLRPYRFGDPSRLIHWRSSAKYGELRVRELEIATGGQEIVIALDSGANWADADFEQAVIVAASLYFYTNRRSQLNVQLWTGGTGLVYGNWVVLQALASVNRGEKVLNSRPDHLPLIWITNDRGSLGDLPMGSRWVLWPDNMTTQKGLTGTCPGLEVIPERLLMEILQSPLYRPVH